MLANKLAGEGVTHYTMSEVQHLAQRFPYVGLDKLVGQQPAAGSAESIENQWVFNLVLLVKETFSPLFIISRWLALSFLFTFFPSYHHFKKTFIILSTGIYFRHLTSKID